MSRFTATSLLIVATAIWGFAFIAQKHAMGTIGPLTFIAARYLLGGLAILPLAFFEMRRVRYKLTGRDWAVIMFLTVNFFLASWLQQWGIVSTSVTNAGFLTGLYVFFVPLILAIGFRIKPPPAIWVGAPLALAGLYLLSGADLSQLSSGDALVTVSAFFWGIHVLLIGFIARQTGLPVAVSAATFVIAGLMAAIGATATETVSIPAIAGEWVSIAYVGILSTAVAFTLQAVGQVYVPTSNAAIILSAETLFAALGGAVVLGERLTPIGYAGAALIFLAIVLVEAVPAIMDRRARRSPTRPPPSA